MGAEQGGRHEVMDQGSGITRGEFLAGLAGVAAGYAGMGLKEGVESLQKNMPESPEQIAAEGEAARKNFTEVMATQHASEKDINAMQQLQPDKLSKAFKYSTAIAEPVDIALFLKSIGYIER